MSVSSALSSFLLCCFYPSTGGHRAGAYYYSSHPTSTTNTLYYNEGGLRPFAGRRMMGRSSRPLSLQVRAFASLPCSVLSSSVMLMHVVKCEAWPAGSICKYGNLAWRMRCDMLGRILCLPLPPVFFAVFSPALLLALIASQT